MTDTTSSADALNPPPAPADANKLAPPADSVTSAASPEPAVETEAPSADGVTAATPAAEPDATQTETPAAKPRKSPDERIRDVIAEREFWKRKALEQAPPAKPEPAASAPPELKRPALDDFETVDAWAAAYDEYADKRAEAAVERKLGKQKEQEAQAAVQTAFQTREQQYAATNPDYFEAVSDPTLQEFTTPAIGEAVVRSENGPALAFHLATNRDTLQAIARLPIHQQAFELGKLSASLGAPKPAAAPAVKKPVQQTRAPAPPTPVNANQGSTDPKKIATADEWLKWRQADLAAKRAKA